MGGHGSGGPRAGAGRKRILRGPYRLSARLTTKAHGNLTRECRRLGVSPSQFINDLLEALDAPQAVAYRRKYL